MPVGKRRFASVESTASAMLRAELYRPAADRLVGDVDTLLHQHLLYVTEADGEPKYSRTAWRMTSAGNLCRLNESGRTPLASSNASRARP